MNYCTKCHKSPNDCPCENPNWVDEDGEELGYREGVNEKVNRIVKNNPRKNSDDDLNFKYVAGDPFW